MSDTRRFLLLLATVLVGSISYYFVIALPTAERERLAFEKQKYHEAQQEKTAKEKAASDQEETRKKQITSCQTIAEGSYWNYVKLNGRAVPGKEGTYTALPSVWETARKNKKDAFDECMAAPW